MSDESNFTFELVRLIFAALMNAFLCEIRSNTQHVRSHMLICKVKRDENYVKNFIRHSRKKPYNTTRKVLKKPKNQIET